MEKQRSKTNTKSFKRLLTFFTVLFLISGNIFSQTLSASEIRNLRIKPSEGQSLYTKTDLKFELLIPKVKASQIQFISNNQSSDVTLRTIRKVEDYENGGTLIEIWFNFDKKGTYSLSPLKVQIQGKKRDISFQQVTITDDPAKQFPRMVIKFNNGTTLYSDTDSPAAPVFTTQAGKKNLFTVYLQYASQLINFTYDLPKDAIFSQTQSYDIMEVRYREKNISHDLIPVASFQWTSLTKGMQPLPKIKITATSYSGTRYDLLMPEINIAFSEGTYSSGNSKDDRLFDAAFTEEQSDETLNYDIEITDEICETLAKMYKKERNSIFNQHSLKKQRQKFELENNLPVNYEKDYSIRIIAGSILLFLGALLLLILSIHDKKIFRIMISVVLIVFTVIFAIYGFFKRAEVYGICTGCTIYSIPEETAEAKAEMGAGNKVRVTELSSKWYYIELGETGGWCESKNIILIK